MFKIFSSCLQSLSRRAMQMINFLNLLMTTMMKGRIVNFVTFLPIPILISSLPMKPPSLSSFSVSSSSFSSASSQSIQPPSHGASHTSLLLQRLLQAQIAEAQCVLRCKSIKMDEKEAVCLQICQSLMLPKSSNTLCHLPRCRSRCKAGCFGNKKEGDLVDFHLKQAPCSITWNSESKPSSIQLLYLVAARDLGGKWHLVANPLAATSIPILQLKHYIEVRVLAISKEGLEDEASLMLNDDILHNTPFGQKPIFSICHERGPGKRHGRNTGHQDDYSEQEIGEKILEEDKEEGRDEGRTYWQPMEVATLLLPSFFIILSFIAILLLIRQKKVDTKAIRIDEKVFGRTSADGNNDMPPPIYEEIDNYCVL